MLLTEMYGAKDDLGLARETPTMCRADGRLTISKVRNQFRLTETGGSGRGATLDEHTRRTLGQGGTHSAIPYGRKISVQSRL